MAEEVIKHKESQEKKGFFQETVHQYNPISEADETELRTSLMIFFFFYISEPFYAQEQHKKEIKHRNAFEIFNIEKKKIVFCSLQPSKLNWQM